MVPLLLVFASRKFNQVLCPVQVIPVLAVGDDPVPVGREKGKHSPGDRPKNNGFILLMEIIAKLLEQSVRFYTRLQQRGQTIGGSLVGAEKNGVLRGLVYLNPVGITPEEKGDRGEVGDFNVMIPDKIGVLL